MLNIEPIEYEPPAEGHCCDVCNPLHFADYETSCIALRRVGGNRTYVCVPCVRAMSRAVRGETQHNGRDRARWSKLEAKAHTPRRAP